MNAHKDKWLPKFDKEFNLIGPYPEVIDLCSEGPIDLGIHLVGKMEITADKHVKRIVAPSDQIGIDYISIKDLPSLEDIAIKDEFGLTFGSLQWVEINNCPKLKKVSIKGGVVSLTVTGSSSLEFLDISGCGDIDRVEIHHPKHGLKIDARGCVKLREIIGLDNEISESSGLKSQVLDIQRLSRRDGKIYDSMTFTDIDIVKKIINDGVKSLSRMGRLYEADPLILGYYGLKAFEREFVPFDYRILAPLEPVYTGGTGETYAYVSRESYTDSDGVTAWQQEDAGNSSPEACLKYSLHSIRNLFGHIPQIASSTTDELLDLLKEASKPDEESKYIGIPILVSSFIDSVSKSELMELALEIGVKIASDMDEVYVFITSAKDTNPEEAKISRSALFSLDLSSALDQLKSAWYWRYKGKTICLSGKVARGNKKKAYETAIGSSEYKLVKEIRRGLSYLVNDDPESSSGKVAQARKLGIRVISEEELQSMLMSKKLVQLSSQLVASRKIF
jgi:hypothetical protein